LRQRLDSSGTMKIGIDGPAQRAKRSQMNL